MKNETPWTTWTSGDGSDGPTSNVPAVLSGSDVHRRLSRIADHADVDAAGARIDEFQLGWIRIARAQAVGAAAEHEGTVLDGIGTALAIRTQQAPVHSLDRPGRELRVRFRAPSSPSATEVAGLVLPVGAHVEFEFA